MEPEIKLRESRKAFILEYLMAVLALISIFVIRLLDIDLNVIIFYVIAGIAFLGIVVPEVSRYWRSWVITKRSIVVKTGFLSKNETRYFMETVTDVNLQQSFLQQMLKYGTLVIGSFSHSGNIIIPNINHPVEVMSRTEKMFGLRRAESEKRGPSS